MSSTVASSKNQSPEGNLLKSNLILSGLRNKRIPELSQMLKAYIQKKHTLDDSTNFTTLNQTLSPRANNSMVPSPKSTMFTPRNKQSQKDSTIKKEPEIFRDFKIEILNKIVDPLQEVIENEFDQRVTQETYPDDL